MELLHCRRLVLLLAVFVLHLVSCRASSDRHGIITDNNIRSGLNFPPAVRGKASSKGTKPSAVSSSGTLGGLHHYLIPLGGFPGSGPLFPIWVCQRSCSWWAVSLFFFCFNSSVRIPFLVRHFQLSRVNKSCWNGCNFAIIESYAKLHHRGRANEVGQSIQIMVSFIFLNTWIELSADSVIVERGAKCNEKMKQ